MKVKSVFAVKFLFWVIFFLVAGRIVCQQSGLKYLKNYSRTDYDQQPQNWAILQDKRGIIYVGNNGCVLEFDGISWRSITVKDNRPVRSMTIGHNGTIYIGSSNEIGYLDNDANGTLHYVSLRPYLPEDKMEFTHVKRTLTAKEGIYFTAKEFLFRWDSQQLKVWTPRHGFDSSLVCGEAFFIRDGKLGLLQMIGESLLPVPGGETFADAEVLVMAPYGIKKRFIATRTKGCYLYDGEHFAPFPTEVDEYLLEQELYRGIRLSCGDYALTTLRGGLVIINAAGRLIQIFDKSSGLQDNDVKYVCEDFQGNLWLGLSVPAAGCMSWHRIRKKSLLVPAWNLLAGLCFPPGRLYWWPLPRGQWRSTTVTTGKLPRTSLIHCTAPLKMKTVSGWEQGTVWSLYTA